MHTRRAHRHPAPVALAVALALTLPTLPFQLCPTLAFLSVSAPHTEPCHTMPKKTGHDELVRRALANGFEANLSQYDPNPVRKTLRPKVQAQYDQILVWWTAYASRQK